jgi:hypothetical protein
VTHAEKSAQKSESAKKSRDEDKIDSQVEDSFPASDPPSYAGGAHRAGAPKPPRPSDGKSSEKP